MTGATGYVGGRLALRLAGEGLKVHALVRPGRASALPPGLEAHEDEGTTPWACRLLERLKPRTVFHLAAHGGHGHGPGAVDAMLEANVCLGGRLIEAASRSGASLVAAGSWWQLAGPRCLYAETKKAQARLLEWAAAGQGLRALTLLLFDVYGPSDPRPKLLPKLLEASRTGEPLPAGPGLARLDLVHVEDVVEAFLHAAALLERRPELSGESFAIRSGEELAPRQLAELLAELSGREVPVTWGALPAREGEPSTPPDHQGLPGWSARRRLREALVEILARD